MQRAWLAVVLIAVGCHRADDDGWRVVVTASWPGASAEIVEREVVAPLEDAVAHAKGVARIVGRARPGVAVLTIAREGGADADAFVLAVQAQLAMARARMPRDLMPPTVAVRRAGLARYWLLAPRTDHAPLAQLVAPIARLPGVVSIATCGDRTADALVSIDVAKAAAQQVDVLDVADALGAGARAAPRGNLDGTRMDYTLATADQGPLDGLAHTRVAPSAVGGGATVEVRDVALLEQGAPSACIAATSTGATGVAELRGSFTRDAREGMVGELARAQLALVDDAPLYAIEYALPPDQGPHAVRAVVFGRAAELGRAPGVAWAVARADLDADPSTLRVEVALAKGADPAAVLGAIANAPGGAPSRVDGTGEVEAVLPTDTDPAAATRAQAAVKALHAQGLAASCDGCEGEPELALDIDRARAADLGVDPARVVRLLAIARGSYVATTVYTQSSAFAVRVALLGRDGRTTSQQPTPRGALVEALADLRVRGASGMVPLSEIVRAEARLAAPEIRSENRRRVLLVWARGRDARAALAAALPGAELRARHAIDD